MRLSQGLILLALLATRARADEALVVKPSPKPAGLLMTAQFTDQGSLQVEVLESELTLVTKFGELKIPLAEIRKLEFAARVPAEVTDAVTKAVAQLASENFNTRVKAGDTLLLHKLVAYPLLLKAAESRDLEVAKRAEELLEQIKQATPAEQLISRANDAVTTEDSTIAGTIKNETLNVRTKQFGEQSLKLSEVRTLSTQPAEPPEEEIAGHILPDPGSLTQYNGQFGSKHLFRVTGNINGTVWGTGVHTTDSNLATAAVHGGALKLGETGVVKVEIIASPAQFTGSAKNGITTHNYSQYPAAYKVTRVRGKK
jgi:hypothetical protein